MALIDCLLTQIAKVEPFVQMKNGNPVYGKPETRLCRIEIHDTLKRSAYMDGRYDAVNAEATMFTSGAPIPDRSRITVDGRKYTSVQCKQMTGFRLEHLEVLLT